MRQRLKYLVQRYALQLAADEIMIMKLSVDFLCPGPLALDSRLDLLQLLMEYPTTSHCSFVHLNCADCQEQYHTRRREAWYIWFIYSEQLISSSLTPFVFLQML